MEIVGVVAGIPALIHFVQGLTTTLRALATRKHGTKAAEALLIQLRDIEEILKDVQRRWKTNPIDKSQLQGLDPVLTQLRSEFSSLQSTLQIKFAKKPSRFLRRALPLSSRLDKTLNKSLNRVSQVKTSLTLIIAHHHERLAEEHLEISSSDLRLTLRHFLRPSGDHFIPQRLDETCEWIWSHPAFTPWIDKPASPSTHSWGRIFCLYGPKGCGKSVLVKSIAEQLSRRGELVSHFAFWAGSETQRRFLDFLRSLLWQLLRPLPDSQVRVITSPLISDSATDETSILAAINQALAASTANFYCLVDGIDESLDDWNIRGQGCLRTVLGLVESHPRLHLLIAAREPSIRTLLKDATLKLEVTEGCTRSDINKFIAMELDNVLTIQSPDIKQLVQTSLQEKSQVMFLWTTLILSQLRRCYTVDEIKKTLEQVPHDLDREYHRLFRQLMTRTRGTQTKPSPSMNRARILLTSVLASPEPLTADELRYAYATHTHNGAGLENTLIQVDGIVDACGDFLRITDDRYHLIHASLIDFLTRPLEKWCDDDASIQYFRVDRSEAHKHMASVCVGYLELLDLGYPLIDGGSQMLPSKHALFTYATTLLPYFFVRVLNFGDNAWAHSEIYRAIQTPQACALLEYALATIQGDLQPSDVDQFHYWSELVSANFQWRPKVLLAAYEKELQRRRQCFGPDDTRYQAWESISLLITMYYPHWTGLGPVDPAFAGRGNLNRQAISLVQGGSVPTALSMFLDVDSGAHGEKVSRGLYKFSKVFRGLEIIKLRDMVSDLKALSPDVLPVPLVLLTCVMACRRQDWIVAEKLAATAVKRTRGRGTFWECLSLGCLALGLLANCREDRDEAIRLARESINMASRVSPQPHYQITKIGAYVVLTILLMCETRDEEASDTLHCLERLVGKDRTKSGSRIFETLCRTRQGLGYRMRCLRWVALQYYQRENYADTVSLLDRALAIYKGAPDVDKPTRPTRVCLVTQKNAHWIAGNHQECIDSCHQLLRFLGELPADRVDPINSHIQRQAYKDMAWCCARLDRFDEAKKAFCQAALDVNILDHTTPEWVVEHLTDLAYGLLLVGRYEESSAVSRKSMQLRNIQCDKGALSVPAFQSLQPLVDKLGQMAMIDSKYNEFIYCASQLRVAEYPDQDSSEEASWWTGKWWDLDDPPVPAFRGERAIFMLKGIEIYICRDNSVEMAFSYYRELATYFSEIGNQQASEVVSADAVSRYFDDASQPLWQGLILLADVALFSKKFHQVLILLRLAWHGSLSNLSFDWLYFFAEEYVRSGEYISRTKPAGDDTISILHPFLRQACAFLVRAREASVNMNQGKPKETPDYIEEGYMITTEDWKYRESCLEELDSRLKGLGADPLLATAGTEAQKPPEEERKRLRRAISLEDMALDQPRMYHSSNFARSRSLEPFRGVPE